MTIKPLSRGCALRRTLLILGAGCLSAPAQGIITQAEPDDSIGTANATGITAGSSGLTVAYGNNGDGLYGPIDGDSTGDMDFFKVSANAGQVITVQLKNFSTSDDFDSLIGIYSYSSGSATVLAGNDDLSGGVSRASALTFTAPTTGDYYVCVSNWIDAPDPENPVFGGQGSLPNDPLTPGTGNGPPGGTAGPYQLFIGLDYHAPIPQFDGTGKANPTPPLNPTKVVGTTYVSSNLKISNSGNSDYTFTAFSITGPDAAKFRTYGLGGGLTIPAGGFRTVKVEVNLAGVTAPVNATLNFTSNDSLGLSYAMTATPSSPVVGNGAFTAKQVSATATTINTMDLADQLLNGTIAGTTSTSTVGTVNFGTGADGHFGSDVNFPIGATPGDNFVLQVTGTFTIKEAGDYSFLGYSDDGQRLRIDGDEYYSFNDYNTDHAATVTLEAGPHTLEYTMFDGGGGNSAELLISKAQGSFSTFGSTTWEPLEATGADTDSDGIADYMETKIGTNPAVADANADLDTDGLGNLTEIFAGTSSSNPDSDADGLKDGVESNTGVWVSLTNTGTSPLLTDSDTDGLADNVENPGLPSTGVTQPGTDPNKTDSDGDTFADYAEIAFGTNPKDPASKPVTNYQTVVTEDFEAPHPHSVFGFNALNAAPPFEAGEYASDIASHGSVARLTDNIGGSHNSVSFDYVDITPGAIVQLSFDYRIASSGGDAADGFGIGLFRKSAYGTAGVSPAIVDAKLWENPTGGGGYANALFFGFGVYGADTVRLIGPAAPTVPLATYVPLQSLVTSQATPATNTFSRAVITILSNSPTTSVVSMEIIRDVDGAATHEPVFTNVLIPDFQIKTEQLRLIAGARTGSVFSQVELDNIKYSVLVQSNPTLVLSANNTSFLGDFHDGSAAAVNASTMTVKLNGAPLTVTTTKTGTQTTVSYPGTPAAFFPPGTNTLVFSYTTTTGTPVTETRTFDSNYVALPASLAIAPSSAGSGGFAIHTVQMDPIVLGTPEVPAPQTMPNSLDYREGILSGVTGSPFTGGNLADPVGATNGTYQSDVINFEQTSAAAGFFGENLPIPGIPGTTASNDNYTFEALTWINFPMIGVYTLGVVTDDGYRVSYTHKPVGALSVTAPASAARIVPFLPSVNGSQLGGVAAPYPATPVTVAVVAADPPTATNTADPAFPGLLNNAAACAGKIVLIDRGSGGFVTKIRAAQSAGAVAAIIINQNNPNAVPAGMGSDGSDLSTITIPSGMISKSDGDNLKSLIASGLQMTIGPDESTTLGKSNAVANTTFNAAVSSPGLYPIRFLSFEGAGGAAAEFFSVDSVGVKHLVNDASDELSLKAYASIATGDGPTISVSQSGGAIIINYTGVLQSSATLSGFTDVTGATSPYSVPAGSPAKMFFRARK